MEPARARPVPFWRQGFAPPPRTSPRSLVAAVPRRRASCSARTASYTSPLWKGSAKTSSGRSTVPWPISRAAVGLGTAHLHDLAPRPGHGSADEQEVAARIDVDHLEPKLGHAPVAHVPRHADALQHPRRRGACADRARCPNVVRTVADGPTVEVVAANRALEALALRAAADLDLLAFLESRDGHLIADLELAVLVLAQAELGEVAEGGRAGLLQMTQPGLLEAALFGLAEGKLDRAVSVALGLAHGRHPAGAGLDHGRRDPLAVFGEQLRHANFASEDPRHQHLLLEADLDVDACGQVVEPLERVDRLRRWLVNVDQPLVRADLEVLARVLVLERTADHDVDVLFGRQRNGARHGRAGALGRLHDLGRGAVDRLVVVGLEPDPDLVLRYRCH